MNGIENRIMPDFMNRKCPFHFATALNILMRMGVDINRMDILAVGEFRNYQGEIHHQQPAGGTPLDEDTRIVLEVGYPSAVDYMPYQFFYGISGVKARTGEWEDNARALMAPFDASVVRYESLVRHQMLTFSLGMVDVEHLVRFLRLFDFSLWDDSPDPAEVLMWASILPSFHFWAGNPVFVTRVLAYLFGYDFQIVENVESEYIIPRGMRSRLGSNSSRLGKELMLGRSFRERDSSYELQVRGVSSGEVVELLPGAEKRRKIEWVLSVCMPNNMDCRIRVVVDQKRLMLGTKNRRSYLGYSTYV